MQRTEPVLKSLLTLHAIQCGMLKQNTADSTLLLNAFMQTGVTLQLTEEPVGLLPGEQLG